MVFHLSKKQKCCISYSLTNSAPALVRQSARHNAGSAILTGRGRAGHVGLLAVQACPVRVAVTPGERTRLYIYGKNIMDLYILTCGRAKQGT